MGYEITPTEHPHIVRHSGISGGSPVIKGSRITVRLIVGFYKCGTTPDEILEMYPHLAPAAVYDAISYYHDHQAEVEKDIEESTLEKVMERNNMVFNERGAIVPRETLIKLTH